MPPDGHVNVALVGPAGAGSTSLLSALFINPHVQGEAAGQLHSSGMLANAEQVCRPAWGTLIPFIV